MLDILLVVSEMFDHYSLLEKNVLILLHLIYDCSPDQSPDILCNYIEQVGVGKKIPICAVAYDCSNHLANVSVHV